MPDITMPRLSDTMEAGVIAAWRKRVGEAVAAGDIVAEIETDKAIMELEAYDDGILERILVGEGESAPIGTPIGVLGDGTSPAAEPDPAPADRTPAPEPAPAGAPGREAGGPPREDRPPASPLARRLARELGVDLRAVDGTGPHGRIIRADIEAAVAADPVPAPVSAPAAPAADEPAGDGVEPPGIESGDVEEVPLSGIQRVAAGRLAQSLHEAPHIYLTRAVDVTDLFALRSTLNATLAAAGGPKISVNDLVVKAVATTLRAHPDVNVSYAGDVVRRHRRVHVGVAVATPAGLLVPVVRDTDRKSVSEIAAEIGQMSGRARERRLRPDEMSGGTFTVSNLGMYGVEQFTAIIDPPQAAILAVGAAIEEIRPRDGAPAVRSIMRITLSCDHRVVDGAVGATFLQTLAALLETPLRILA
jgi:pyruvate dehydrogenase E2 component (dihydrolipoyllysine-residue acetyltransferase)